MALPPAATRPYLGESSTHAFDTFKDLRIDKRYMGVL